MSMFGGKMSYEDEGRDKDDASTSQRLPTNHQTPEEKHGTDSHSQDSEGVKFANTLILGF